MEAAKQFATENGIDLRTIELDVASQESADQAIKTIVEEDGRLDVVIHNAGHMVFGVGLRFLCAIGLRLIRTTTRIERSPL